MKHLITIIVFTVLLNFTLKAQTKEETMNWLGEKFVNTFTLGHQIIPRQDLEQLYNVNSTSVLYINQVEADYSPQDDKGLAIITFMLDIYPEDKPYKPYILSVMCDFRLQNITGFKFYQYQDHDYIEIFLKKVPNKDPGLSGENNLEIFDGNNKLLKGDGELTHFSFTLNWNKEVNLKERIQAALTKLIAFNKQGLQKEAF